MAREAEATATLNAITTAACLVLTFTIQKLGLTLLDRQLQTMKEKTLLKQVRSMQDGLWSSLCHMSARLPSWADGHERIGLCHMLAVFMLAAGVQVESQRRYYEQQDSARATAAPAKAEAKPSGPSDVDLRGQVTELQVRHGASLVVADLNAATRLFCDSAACAGVSGSSSEGQEAG